MAEQSTSSSRGSGPAPADRIPRCCPQHPDWPTLSHHLLADFVELSTNDIVREVRRAKEAVASTGLTGAEALLTGELIARHQLMLLAGRIEEMARLDPETHVRGAGSVGQQAVVSVDEVV